MRSGVPLLSTLLPALAAAGWTSVDTTCTETLTATATASSSDESAYIAQLQSELSSVKAAIASVSQANTCDYPSAGSDDGHAPSYTGAGQTTATFEYSGVTSEAAATVSADGASTAVPFNGHFVNTDSISQAKGVVSSAPAGSSYEIPSVTIVPVSYSGAPLYPTGAHSYGSGNSTAAGTGSGMMSGTASSSGKMTGTGSASSSTSSAAYTGVPSLSDYTDAEIASGEAWASVSKLSDARMQAVHSNNSCTYENARVRKEFRNMAEEDRKSFTDAVMCLFNTPPQMMTDAESSSYPGVKSRYDEYVATHINFTYNIHMTADFLAWHRNFIFQLESDLAEHCGYEGTLPYWDWAMDAEAVDQSPLFSGDAYSMGSNGEYIAGRNYTYLGLQDLNFPPGTGGGCVHSGPFHDYETHLGPIDSPYENNVENSFDLNTRCLVRDLNSWFSSQFNTYTNVTDLVLGETDISNFQSLMQGYLGDNKLGVHGGGHWLGGGPSQLEDFHSSPNDPLFFLHHAQIDRLYVVWKYLDIESRRYSISGTSTLDNSPPSAEMKLSDSVSFGFVQEPQVFGDLMDTMAGPFCYRYE